MPLCGVRAAARSGKAGHDPKAASCERQSCAACLLRFAQRMCPGASTLFELVTPFLCCTPAPQVIGDDVSPGVKAGGRVNWINRTIACIARGDAIPSDFTVDIRCGACRGQRARCSRHEY